jgi:hypothetical protein
MLPEYAVANNSASIIGTAAVGAMADGNNQQFINNAYRPFLTWSHAVRWTRRT